MVAIALPPPKQYSFLEAPRVHEADVTRLSWQLGRMYYGDSLLHGAYALDRVALEDSYVQWTLYLHDRLIGVVEVRACSRAALAHNRLKLARVLLARYEWDVRRVRFVAYGAVTCEELDVARVQRLIEKRHT